MTEYTATEVRELFVELPVLKIEGGIDAREVEELRDALEGADQLVRELPEGVRAEALIEDGLIVGRSLWFPVIQNCNLAAGLSLSPEDALSFAVKGGGEELVEYFSAREAMRHLISGAAGVSDADLPAPEENGLNTRKAAATKTVAAPDASGASFKDLIPEEQEDEIRHSDADVDRDDVSSDGLDQPDGGIRYLGTFAAVQEPGPAPSAATVTRVEPSGVHPDWKWRFSRLLLGGRFPCRVVGEVMRAVEFLGEDEATPGRFLAHLVSIRARLSGEDLVGLSRLDRLGVEAASDKEPGAVRRLIEGNRAEFRLVGGELLLVSTDPDSPEWDLTRAAVTTVARIKEERAADRDAAERRAVGQAIFPSHFPRPATLEAYLQRAIPAAGSRAAALEHLRSLSEAGYLRATRRGEARILRLGGEEIPSRSGLFLCAPGSSREDILAAAQLSEGVEQQSRSNKKAVASMRRSGLKGLSVRLRDSGAPSEEVAFWRSFELKPNGDYTAAYAAPVVPFGGTPIDPEELPEVLRLERAKAAARVSGSICAEVTLDGEWGFRLYRFGRTVCARLTMLSRHTKVFRSNSGAAHCWPVSHTEVLHDPDGHFDAQLAEERFAFGAHHKTQEDDYDRYADELPKAERESGPDPRGASAPRAYRDASREGEAAISTRSGRVLEPYLRPRQREKARRRVASIRTTHEVIKVAEAPAQAHVQAHAEYTADASAEATDKALAPALAPALSAHLSSLPVDERLELYLGLFGPQEISRLKEKASDLTGLFLAACRLKKAGKISIEGGLMSTPGLSTESRRELLARITPGAEQPRRDVA